MNLIYTNLRTPFLINILMIALTTVCFTQEAPIKQNHPINNYIERHITLGNISQSYSSVRPLTYTNVRKLLEQLSDKSPSLSFRDNELLQRFRSEFSIEHLDSKILFPLQKTKLKNLKKSAFGKYRLQDIEPHFLSYRDSNVYAIADIGETVRFETIADSIYRRFTDNVLIMGSLYDNISFFVDFTMNRFVGDSSLVYQIENYRNEDHPYFDFVKWTLWYQSEAAFNISTRFGNFQLGKVPVIWGFSPKHSPILSGITQTYPFVNYSFRYKKIGFNFIHGSLLPSESTVIHLSEVNPQKYLAAHRIEFEINKNLMMSFNEMVIYGNRPFEVEYLIPVNFYWAAEHNQGDRDNLLMALDCAWRIKPGLKIYSTLFWDELAWEKVLTKWWANKFVFQTGLHWVLNNSRYLTDFRVEATVSRPWTYTHNDFVNSYTSAGLNLGLPEGPNAQSLLFEAGIWPSYKWQCKFSSRFIRRGSGLGSSSLDNYDLRDSNLDDNTPYLIGDIQNTTELRFDTEYAVNRIFNVFGMLNYNSKGSNYGGHFGIEIDW